jgi:glycosyltransferase involved in cell wall biosynthesis
VPAVVQQGRGGLLAPAGDAEGLAQALRILLGNRQTRETMGEVAAAFVHNERSIAHAVRQLQPILAAAGT